MQEYLNEFADKNPCLKKVVVDGEYYDPISETGYIEEGETIIVRKFSTGQLYVRKK